MAGIMLPDGGNSSGYVPNSGPGYDYGYLGGGMYVPTPYVAPKPVVKKKANPYPPKGTGSTYDEQVPKQASQPAPSKKKAASTAVSNVSKTYSSPSSSSSYTAAPASAPTTTKAAATTATAAPAVETVTPPPTTRDVVIPDITLDPTYQQQIAALAQAATDAATANTKAKGDYDVTYNGTLRNVGWDPVAKQFASNDRGTQYGSAFRGNLEDYTGRGLGYSSDYFGDLSNLNNTFVNQVGQLSQARDAFRQAQDDSLSSYNTQNTLQKTAALSDAAARVAASLGIDQSQVPLSGGKKTITVPVTQTTSS